MEEQFSDSSFAEANRLIHSAFNSTYAMNQAKNVAIRKQLLEAAIQKLLESKTFYISDVRDIAAMNSRPFDSRSKLYEQLNILNCREYRKMRSAVLELLPLMIHRATGIAEERFTAIVDANRVDRSTMAPAPAIDAAQVATPTADELSAKMALPAVADAVEASRSRELIAAPVVAAAAEPVAAAPEAANVVVPHTAAAASTRPVPLLLSLGLNLMLGAALFVSVQQMRSGDTMVRSDVPAINPAIVQASLKDVTPAGAPNMIDSVVRTSSPAASLSQLAAALPLEKGANGQQYIVGVQIQRAAN